jgi:hypothetical protein
MTTGVTQASGVTAVPGSGSGGAITSIVAGTGLSGGGASGAVTVGINPAISVGYTVAQSITTTPASNTSNDGLSLIDATAATAANQQFSPRLHFTGQGWATTPVASQPVDWIVEEQVQQGTTNPTSSLVFSSQINGSGYVVNVTLNSGGNGIMVVAGPVQANAFRVISSTVSANGIYLPVTNALGFSTNSVARGSFDANGNFITLFAHADQSKSVQVPVTAFSITIANNTSTLILNPAGTLATGTITMPATPIDGQEVQITSSQTVTACTFSPNASQTISNAPTTLVAGVGNKFIYHLAGTNWYRLY